MPATGTSEAQQQLPGRLPLSFVRPSCHHIGVSIQHIAELKASETAALPSTILPGYPVLSVILPDIWHCCETEQQLAERRHQQYPSNTCTLLLQEGATKSRAGRGCGASVLAVAYAPVLRLLSPQEHTGPDNVYAALHRLCRHIMTDISLEQ